jgi:hypothetical protein
VVWFELQADTVMMNTLRGRRKNRNLMHDPRVSPRVEAGMRYVSLAGTIAMNDDPETGQASIAALDCRHKGDKGAARMARESFSRQQRVTLTLHVDKVDAHVFDDED